METTACAARFGEGDVARLLADVSIIRNRRKIEAIVKAHDLKRRGWRFVGPTTVYAFMQAMGVVNDHSPGCEAGEAAARARKGFKRP